MDGLTDDAFSEAEEIDPRELWESEPAKFTPWLARNLHRLGKELGFDLELVATEAPAGDFQCDIVARETGGGRTAIIENQLERTDHDHLGKLLTYAAKHDASIVVWISPDIREGHREAVNWLNRRTDENLEFFAVKLKALRIDNSRPAPVFDIQAFPNTWSRTRGNLVRRAPSQREELYREFFQALIDEMRERHHFTNARVGMPQSWYDFASGINGIRYSASFVGGNRLRVQLYIDVGDKIENEAIFDWLAERREKIEREFGSSLEWERLDNRRASRIAISRIDTNIDTAATQSDQIRAWVVDNLLRMKRVFGPLLGDAAAAGERIATPVDA
jgi:Domain of unknown function (DUF4268)